MSAQLPCRAKNDIHADATTTDSDILDSCSDVFSASTSPCCFRGRLAVNISGTENQLQRCFPECVIAADCVTCQKCKLHGKVALMGMGTALKILLAARSFPIKACGTHSNRSCGTGKFTGKFSSSISAIDKLERQSWRKATLPAFNNRKVYPKASSGQS